MMKSTSLPSLLPKGGLGKAKATASSSLLDLVSAAQRIVRTNDLPPAEATRVAKNDMQEFCAEKLTKSSPRSKPSKELKDAEKCTGGRHSTAAAAKMNNKQRAWSTSEESRRLTEQLERLGKNPTPHRWASEEIE